MPSHSPAPKPSRSGACTTRTASQIPIHASHRQAAILVPALGISQARLHSRCIARLTAVAASSSMSAPTTPVASRRVSVPDLYTCSSWSFAAPPSPKTVRTELIS